MRRTTVRTLFKSCCADKTENSTLPASMRNYPFTGTMRPVYPLSPKRDVPKHIKKPDYADDRESSERSLG